MVKKSSLRNPIQGAALVRLQHSRRDRRQERLLADAAGGKGFQHRRQAIHVDSWAQASVCEMVYAPPLPKGPKFASSGSFAVGRDEHLSKPDVHDMFCTAHLGWSARDTVRQMRGVLWPIRSMNLLHATLTIPPSPTPKIKNPPPPFANENLLLKPPGFKDLVEHTLHPGV